MNSYIRPVNGITDMHPSHALLYYTIEDYYNLFEERSIKDFEEIARFLHHEIFFEYEEGMTPFTLAYLQRNHDCFNVSRFWRKKSLGAVRKLRKHIFDYFWLK